MFQSDLLNCRSYFHLFFHRVLFLQRPVEASAAHRHHLAHALDAEAALQRHHFSDLVVDVISPEPLLRWRRAAIFCKAPLKNPPPSSSLPEVALIDGFVCDPMLHAWTAGPFPLPAPLHRACGATCRGIAELLPAPAPTRQRFRWSSCALRPYSETSGNIVFSSRVVLSPKLCPSPLGQFKGSVHRKIGSSRKSLHSIMLI